MSAKRGHIITCKTYADYQTFILNGYAGLYPIPIDKIKYPIVTNGAIGGKIGTNWDVIADLKRVKPDDYIFIHTEGMIYGPFLATSHFKEDPNMPSQFQSANLTPNHWQSNYSHQYTFANVFPYRVSIESIDDVTRDEGFPAMELFKLIPFGNIISIPQRFKYGDKSKIVKPLLDNEVPVILGLLSNTASPTNLSVSPANLSFFNQITLDLNDYSGELFREKILEAWLMENATDNGNNNLEYTNMNTILGSAEQFINSIFTHYTNFMDVLLYDTVDDPVPEKCKTCNKFTMKNKTNLRVIELKKPKVKVADKPQIEDYYDWTLRTLANGQTDRVKMFFIGKGFSKALLSQTTIKCVKYTLYSTNPKLRLELLN